MAIKLFIQKEGEESRELDFEGPVVSIGRGDDNHLVVDDVRSSRKHCSVSETPQGALLEDLGSSNGTSYKGELVTRSLLNPGDKFLIGSTSFFFARLPEAADAAPAAPLKADAGDSPADLLDEIELAESDAGGGDQEDGWTDLLDEPEPAEKAETTSPDVSPLAPPSSVPAETGDDGSQEGAGPSAVGGVVAHLQQVVGELEAADVAVEKLPFSIGRSSNCDLTLNDQRASGRHAELVSKDGVLAIVDLGSKNGVLVDERKVKKAGVLGDGGRITIGSHIFDVTIIDPALKEKSTDKAQKQQARREELVPRGEPAEAMKLSVDIDAVNPGESWHQIAYVVLLVAVVAFSAYFSVRVAQDLLVTEEIDRKRAGNNVSNWSFEETAPEAEDQAGVFEWTAGKGVRIERVKETGTSGGLHAMELAAQGAAGSGIYSAVNDKTIDVSPGQQYLFEGYVTNQGAFLAGLMVEWVDDSGKLMGRSFSIPQDGGGNAGPAIQVVAAPNEDVDAAKVSCFIMGKGRAWFDQVSFAPVKVSENVDPVAGAEGEAEAEPGKVEGAKKWGWADPEPGDVRMQIQSPGIFKLRRGNRQLLSSFWAGIDAGRDPNIIGPGLTDSAPPRESDDGTLVIATRVTDLVERKWIAVENVISADSSSVSLNWQLELQGEKADQERALVVYFEYLDPSRQMVAHGPRTGAEFSLEEAAGGPFDELVVGEEKHRTSMEFTRTVNISTRKHPVFADRWLLVIVPADGASDLGVTFSHGSRREAQAARMKLAEAERLFGAGKASEAISLLEKLPDFYPQQETEIERSRNRITQWNTDAGKVVSDLDVGLDVYRGNPSEVIYRSLRSRGRLLSERYAGTSVGESVGRKIAVLDSIRTTAASDRATEEQEELLAAANRFKDDKRYGIAGLYIRMLLGLAQEGSRIHQDALNLRKLIETRSKAENEVKLGQ